MKFYAYIWTREDGSPYYIGKGQGQRAFINGSHSVRKPKDPSRIQIIAALSEDSAYETEKFLIKYYGRKDIGTGCLRNRSDGGEFSTTGHKHSEETLQKLRGPKSEEHKQKLRLANLGKKQSPETTAKIAASMTGRKRSPEVGAAISVRQLGRVLSAETRQRISEARKGQKWQPEARQKMSAFRTGRKWSPEVRQRMSEARKAWWATRHQEQAA